MDAQTLYIVIIILLLANVVLSLVNLFGKKDNSSENYLEENPDIEKSILELYMKIKNHIPSLSSNDEKKMLDALEVIKKHREEIKELLKIYMPNILLYEVKAVKAVKEQNNIPQLISKKMDNLKSQENVEPIHLLLEPLHLLMIEADNQFQNQLQLSNMYFELESLTFNKYISEKDKKLKQQLLEKFLVYRNKVTECGDLAYKISQVMMSIRKEIDAKQQSQIHPTFPPMHKLPRMKNLPGMTEAPRTNMPIPNHINLHPKPNNMDLRKGGQIDVSILGKF